MDALDTSILIWGIRRESPKDRPDMVPRCIALLESLRERRSGIMVPSIVVAEYLAAFPLEEQEEQRRVIGRHFFVAPFDGAAAAIVGELYSKRAMQDAQAASNSCRQCVKSDLKIIATAITHRATRIYTNNIKHFMTLACGRIMVEDVPALPPPKEPQKELFR